LDKNVVLFKTVLALLKNSNNELLKSSSLEDFKNCIKDTFGNFNEISFLAYYTILKRYDFNLEVLNKNRIFIEPTVIDYINKVNLHKQNKLIEKINQNKDECSDNWVICVYDCDSVYKVHDFFVCREGASPEFLEDYLVNFNKVLARGKIN